MKVRLFPDQIQVVVDMLIRRYIADDKDVKQLVSLFIEADLDGFHTHGLARLPRFLDELKRGEIVPNGRLTQVHSMGGWEVWDGNSGIGPLHALVSTQRAVELARRHGVTCISLRNTNHWLRPGYYGKHAAEQGCAFLCWTNTIPNVVAYGGMQAGIGNNPLTIAIPGDECPFLLDMAMSQFSYGKLAEYAADERLLPAHGGYDAQSQLTNDAQTIFQRQSATPIGLWKGTGLSMALDLLAALLSGGQSTQEIGNKTGEQNVSQVFMAFDLISYYGEAKYKQRACELFEQIKQANPGARIPGEGMLLRRADQIKNGIEIDAALWQSLCDQVDM